MQPLRFRQTKPSKSAWERSIVGQKDSFRRFVIQYHRRLLLDGTLMVQVLLMMSILPYIFLLSGAAGASKNIGGLSPYLTPQYLVPLALVAFLIGVFNSFGGLTSIGISLERENFGVPEIAPYWFQSAISSWSFGCSIWCNPSFLSFFWLVFVSILCPSLGHPCHVADLGRNHYSDMHSRLCQRFSKF